MSTIDKNLARTAYSGINYDNILRDIITIIQNDPDFSFDMEDFTSSNAGRMILELYAYVGDQLATRLDWYVNENFLPTATQRESVIKILKLIGYKLGLPISSSVEVSLTPKANLGEKSTLTKYVSTETAPSFYPYSLSAQGLDGSTLNFEALSFNSDTQEFNYKEEIIYDDNTKKLTFWEGTTIVEDFIVETDNNQVFYLTHPNVAKNSIQVYKVITKDNGNSIEEKKLTYVNSFLERDAQKAQTQEEKEDIPYTYNLEGNTITLEFAPISLIPRASKRPSLGDRIRVFYRVGGGENTNIVKKAINTTLPIEGDDTHKTVQITFTNLLAATGGENEETKEHAKEYAPLTIRAQDRTVNEEDYITIGKGYDKVYKIKTYGVKNLDAEEVYERYGEYIKPLEAWNYILCKNNGYQDLKDDEFNKFRWITQDYENRFNEKYAFSRGKFNVNLTDPDLTDESTENNFKNYFSFDVEASSYMKAKLAKEETSSSVKKFVDTNNWFENIIDTTENRTSIEKVFNPQRTSVDLSGEYKPAGEYLSFDIDNREVDIMLVADDDYINTNAALLNGALQGTFPAEIVITSQQSILEQATNSEPGDEDNSLVFVMKIDGVEREVIVPLSENTTVVENWVAAISTAFDIPDTRINISDNSGPEHLDTDPFETTIQIINEGYETQYHFVEILSYPEVIGFDSDIIYGGGDYDEIAYAVDNKYIVVKSPNTGEHAKVGFNYKTNTSSSTYCTGTFFGIEDFNKDKNSFGYQKLTYTPGVGSFYYENGFFDLKVEYDENNNLLNDGNFFLNYLIEENDEIEFGNYAAENFSEDNPAWREPATRVYNTIYNTTDVDYKKSIPIVKFAYNEQVLISLFQPEIEEITYDTDKVLAVSDLPCVEFDWDDLDGSANISIGIDVPGISPFNEDNETTFTSSNSQTIQNFITLEKQSTATGFITAVNNQLRNLYRPLRMPVYSSFAYAVLGEGNLVSIYSPIRNVNSNVCCIYKKTNEESAQTYISTADNDFCLTHKYKSAPNYGVSGYTIKTKSDEVSEEIKVGDTLLYGNNKYYYVVSVETDVDDADYIRIKIGPEYENETVDWDNAPNIFFFTNNTLYLQKVSDNFPDLEFYSNYIADKRYIPGIYEKYSDMTEEEELKNYLDKYKILAIENVFKQPIINTFDISGTIYYNSRLYTEDFVQKSVSDALKVEFSLDNMDFGESIKKSKVLSVIQNLACVQWIDLKYIRRSYNYGTELGITENEILCNFDEILILSDDYYEEETSLKHGLLFEYTSEN